MKRKFTTNSRVVYDLLANYVNTFTAFCELINNSIQAEAKNIKINIAYSANAVEKPISKIIIADDGHGVHSIDIEKKLLDIGTKTKTGGQGVGRFAALQIGNDIKIETIGFCPELKTYSKILIPIEAEQLAKSPKIEDIDFETIEETLNGGLHNTYYKVEINDIHHGSQREISKKQKLGENFLKDKISDAIFERYPLKIFNKSPKFYLNEEYLNPENYIIGTPEKSIKTYINQKGEECKVYFDFLHINSNADKRKIFLTTSNAGIQTIANSFEFDANWLSPKIGTWYIYIWSDSISADLYRNFNLEDLDPEIRNYKTFVKEKLNEFFKTKNEEFDSFSYKLENDLYYPYREKKASSKSKKAIFNKLAYLVEDKYFLLKEQSNLRELIYPLIDKTIANGELTNILRNILKLNTKMVSKFNLLLEKTELENLIEFSEKLTNKLEDIDFLEKINYSEISKHVKERKQLHKFVETMLWLFGEEYNDCTTLLSDKNLGANLNSLREKFLLYEPKKKDENLDDTVTDKSIKSITDLFFYSEKIIDKDKREVLVVELKAPKVKLGIKELEQVKKYAYEIEQSGKFSEKLKFKIILIGTNINDRAKYEIEAAQEKEENPYFYFRSKKGNIEIWVLKWSDLFENLKRKLKYMSNELEIKDVDIEKKIEEDFQGIEFGRIKSSLRKVENE